MEITKHNQKISEYLTKLNIRNFESFAQILLTS
jgi:hypothetical protein